MRMRGAALAATLACFACGMAQGCGGTSDTGGIAASDDGGASNDVDATSGGHACVPGQQVACACPGGGRGAQACNADGTGFGACLGCGGATGDDGGAMGNDGGAIGDDSGASGDDGGASGRDGGATDDASGATDASDGAVVSRDSATDARDSATDEDGSATRDAGSATDDAASDAQVDAGADASCSTVAVPAARAPVFMLFALDGSGSMSDNNKWTAATAAIDAVFADMEAKADPGLGAGLIVFSDTNDQSCLGLLPTCGPYPTSADVPIAFVDSAQQSKLDARTASPDGPSGATPTGTVLTGGYSELGSFSPQPPLPPSGKKVLVLITDGVPTDECAPTANDAGVIDYPSNACMTRAAAALAEASPQGPVETFVVGVGTLPSTDVTSYDPYFLGALAQAGGTAPASCNPKANAAGATDLCYFNVDPAGAASTTQAALESALDAIRGQVATCSIPIVLGSAGPLDPGRFNVELGSTTIVPQDATNGWTYDNVAVPKNVILHGAACATIQNAPSTKITFLLGCPTAVH